MIMILLWRNVKQSNKDSRGMLFISLAMFSWTLVGAYKLTDPPMPSLINAINDRILSAFSNLFILASLPFFPNVFSNLRKRFSLFRNKDQWVNVVFIFFAIVTVIFTLIDRSVDSDIGRKSIIAVDSFISTVTISAVSVAFYQSLCQFWKDKWLRVFLALMFLILISTQIVLPLVAIFPEVMRPYYMLALVLLLLGLTYFNFVSIAYFGMYNLEFKKSSTIENSEIEKVELYPEYLTLGYDKQRKLYFIRVSFILNGMKESLKEIEVSSPKLLQPFANWVLFSLATKHHCKLSHQDLSTSKFRMVEFWNKESQIDLSQEQVFNNDRGFFDLKFEPEKIRIEDTNFLYSKFIIREAILKHIDCFESFIDQNRNSGDLSKTQKEELIIQQLFDLKN